MRLKISIFLFFVQFVSVAQGFKVDTFVYNQIPLKIQNQFSEKNKLPSKVDLSKYAPNVIDQQNFETCNAVSTTYYMRTILEAIKRGVIDKDSISRFAFSPSYVFNLIKNPSDVKCQNPTVFESALDVLKYREIPYLSEQGYPLCDSNINFKSVHNSRIMDYIRLFSLVNNENKVISTKKALSENTPVVVGIQTTISLNELKGFRLFIHKILVFLGFLDDEFALWKPQDSDMERGHAVCVVGYDDKKFGVGAFKVINSWGESWGDNGFFWISYKDYIKYAKQAYQAYLPEDTNDNYTFSGEVAFLKGPYNSENEEPCEYFENRKGIDSLTSYQLKNPQFLGDIYRFSINVGNLTYLYILNENIADRKVKIKRVFPVSDSLSKMLGSKTKIILPLEKNVEWTLKSTSKSGREYCLFLFSKNELKIDSCLNKMNQMKGSLTEKTLTVLGNKLVPLGNIHFDKKANRSMRFQVKGKQVGTVIPIMVRYETLAKRNQ